MPTPRDQMPADATSLARKIVALERDMRELRAAKRAAYTSVQNGQIVFQGASGWSIVLNPGDDNGMPFITFLDPDGNEMGTINASGDPALSSLISSSGAFADGNRSWRWVSVLGELSQAIDCYSVFRAADDDLNHLNGGRVLLRQDYALLAWQDDDDLATYAGLLMQPQAEAQLSGRLTIAKPDDMFTMIQCVETDGLSTVFLVDSSGNVEAAGDVLAQTITVGSGESSIGGNLNMSGAARKNGETWHAPTFASGWATTGTLNGNSTFHGMQYRRDAEDNVWIYGAALSSGTSRTIFTLPNGYLPTTRALIPARIWDASSSAWLSEWCQVTEAGVVNFAAGLTSWTPASGDELFINAKFPLGNIS